MVSFKMFLEASALNVDYKLPSAWETRIYDFYAFSYLSSIIKDRDLDRAEKFHFKETQKTLLYTLKKDLRKEIILSCVGELRHVPYEMFMFKEWDMYRHSPDFKDKLKTVSEKVFEKIGMNDENLKGFLLSIFHYTWLPNSNFSPSPIQRRMNLRQVTYDMMNTWGISEGNVINLSKKIFSEKWRSGYGSTPWFDIARAWEELDGTSSLNELTVMIDHVFDLQHNGNSSFLDKGVTVQQSSEIKDALDTKRNISSIEFLRPHLSRGMRIIVNSYTPRHTASVNRTPVLELNDFFEHPEKYLKRVCGKILHKKVKKYPDILTHYVEIVLKLNEFNSFDIFPYEKMRYLTSEISNKYLTAQWDTDQNCEGYVMRIQIPKKHLHTMPNLIKTISDLEKEIDEFIKTIDPEDYRYKN